MTKKLRAVGYIRIGAGNIYVQMKIGLFQGCFATKQRATT